MDGFLRLEENSLHNSSGLRERAALGKFCQFGQVWVGAQEL